MLSRNINYEFTSDNSNALKGFKEVSNGLNSLNSTSKKTSANFSAYINKAFNSIGTASKSLKSLSSNLKDLSNSMKSVSKEGSSFSKVLSAISGVAVGKALADGTKEAIDFVETMNLFKVAMKDSIEEGQEFIATLQEMYGLDPNYLAKTTGLFYEMAYAVDMPAEAAKRLATNMTATAVDIGSLFNVDFETVADNLTSGLRGMSRAVVKYGMDLRASTVEAYANAHGITAQFETMSEANREILRYLVMMEQATDASGDFARTIESPANQLRIFKEQIVQFGRAIGNFIVQPIAAALPYITGFIMAIRMIISALAELLGFMKWTDSSSSGLADSFSNATSSATSGLGGIKTSADDAKKAVDSLLAPFDELNILSQDTGSAGGGVSTDGGGMSMGVDPELLKLLEESSYKLNDVKLKANEVRDAILGFMGIRIWQEFDEDTGRMITRIEYMPEVFEKNLINKFPRWKKTIQALFDVDWADAWKQIKNIASTLKEIASLTFKNVANDLLAILGINDDSLSQAIGKLNESLRNFSDWLSNNKEAIADMAARALEFMLAWKVGVAIFGALAPVVSAVATGLSGLGTILGFVSTLSDPVVNTFKATATALSGLGGMTSSVASGLATVNGQLALGGTTTTTLIGKLTALAAQFAGPLAAAITAIQVLFAALFVAGFVKWAASSEEFGDLVGDIISTLGDIFVHFGELFVAVKDAFVAGATFMADHFGSVYEAIVNIIAQLLVAFDGIIEFLTGVFTGDTEKAFKGIAKVVGGVANSIATAIAGVLNAVISVVEIGLSFIVNALYDFIKGALDMVAWAADKIGFDLQFPEHVDISLPRIPYPDPVEFANGGVVTGPTRALIGEGKYDEAVIPLGDSPQLQDLIDRIGDKTNNGVTEVHVYIGGKEWDAFTYQSSKRGEKLVGAEPIKVGG